jgi:hypothetical protein
VAIEGASALNRVRWAQAGKEVAVGDSEGRIWIYDVGEVHVCLGVWVLVLGDSYCLCIYVKDLLKLLTQPSGPREPS